MNNNIIEKTLAELNSIAPDFAFPRWSDFPTVGLYMDQVTELVNGYLSKIPAFSESSNITGSMINNYVKSDIMPPPVKKRYSKEHLAYVLIICTLKQTFNISTIKQILAEDFCRTDIAAQYDAYASDFEDSCKKAIADISANLQNNCSGAGILKLMSEISAKKYIVERLTEYAVQDESQETKK